MSADDPVVLFEQATARAATVMAEVSAEQLGESDAVCRLGRAAIDRPHGRRNRLPAGGARR